MHRMSKQPSAKVIGLRRRLKKEEAETIPAKKQLLQKTMDEVKIITPKDYEGEAPALSDVLDGKAKARLSFNGKFASKDTVQQALNEIEESISESYGVISDIRRKLKKLTGRGR